MQDAKSTLDHFYLEMRYRCLSLAADLDRIERAPGGEALLAADPRLVRLRQCIELLLHAQGNRAQQVEMLLSDTSPPPAR